MWSENGEIKDREIQNKKIHHWENLAFIYIGQRQEKHILWSTIIHTQDENENKWQRWNPNKRILY